MKSNTKVKQKGYSQYRTGILYNAPYYHNNSLLADNFILYHHPTIRKKHTETTQYQLTSASEAMVLLEKEDTLPLLRSSLPVLYVIDEREPVLP